MPVPPPSERIEAFLAAGGHETPFVVVDLDIVRDRYVQLAAAFPDVDIFYAVKANPAIEILELLVDMGVCFDVASPAEVDACLAAGAEPEQISYGNTIKKQEWIAAAYAKGIRIFAIDSELELDKVIAVAPGATVCCRILCDGAGAEWPLSRKFGCEPALAGVLLQRAGRAGLGVGLSFHVGSQQSDVDAWSRTLAVVADVHAMLRAHDIEPVIVNIGGGFPGHYVDDVPAIAEYGAAVTRALYDRLGPTLPRVVAEPGRYLVADAGVLRSEVMLVARKAEYDAQRWVYLDVGIFNGLQEATGETIRYPIRTPHDGGSVGPVVLAGPTCDSADILYEHFEYHLPLALQPGDYVDIFSTGAYTTTYSTVGFNGFPPLIAHYLAAR